MTPPTQRELDALPVDKRQELHDGHRQRRWQHLTSFGVLFSLIFTAGGLYFTGKTWETGQDTLRATQRQQITDRYTKAVEQLGSSKPSVRTGGLLALARIASDSPSDAVTIEEVVIHYLQDHDRPEALAKKQDGQAETSGKELWTPVSDVPAAFRALTDINQVTKRPLKIRTIDFSYAQLIGVDLSGVNLSFVTLIGADLSNVILSRATLRGAPLLKATLYSADLRDADLREADLREAGLSMGDIRGADLRGALLYGADIGEADLRGADLRNVDGLTQDQIEESAMTDGTTKF